MSWNNMNLARPWDHGALSFRQAGGLISFYGMLGGPLSWPTFLLYFCKKNNLKDLQFGQEAGDMRENRSHVGTEAAWESVLSGQTAKTWDHSRTFSE